MKSRKGLIILLIVFAAVLIGGAVGYNILSKAPKETSTASAAAPEDNKEEPKETETPSDVPEKAAETDIPAETSALTPPAEPADTGISAETDLEYAADFDFESYDGIKGKLSDLIGKPIIINFWATWCPPCKMELPDFQAAFEEYGSDIQFMMVDLMDGYQETRASLTAFLKETGYTFPVFLDTSGSAVNTYRLYGIPRTVAIDAEGRIIADREGALNADILQGIIDELLG